LQITLYGADDFPVFLQDIAAATLISDTRRYQMLGNSIAVPCVAYIMLGIIEHMNGSS